MAHDYDITDRQTRPADRRASGARRQGSGAPEAMLPTYGRVSSNSVVQAFALVASIAILAGVAAIMAVVVAASCGVALLRAIGAVILAKPSAPFSDHATIEGVVVPSEVADALVVTSDNR
jgi:hypothetical protein